MPGNKEGERGSLLVLTSFLLLALTLLCVSYWKLIRAKTITIQLKDSRLKAYTAARAGIEDAINELQLGHSWQQGSLDLSPQWSHVTGNTFFKSTTHSTPLTHFAYPASFSVTVVGDPSSETVNITSVSSVDPHKGHFYKSQLKAEVVKSLSGDMHIISLKEL